MKYKLKARLLTSSMVMATAMNGVAIPTMAQDVELTNPSSSDFEDDIFEDFIEEEIVFDEYILEQDKDFIDGDILEQDLLENDILEDEYDFVNDDIVLNINDVDIELIAADLNIGTGNTNPLFVNSDSSWIALTEADFKSGGSYYNTGELPTGKYYLSGNILLNRNIVIADNAEVELNLNGNVLDGADGTNSGDVITVGSGAKLTIDDISSGGDTRYSFWYNGDYYLTNTLADVTDKGFTIDDGFIKSGSSVIGTVLTGGVITGGESLSSWKIGTINLGYYSELILNGGNISGNNNYGIGAYDEYATITINNGTISDNIYGGLYLSSYAASLTMTNGEIKSNNSSGIEFRATTTSNLSGGTISNNYYGIYISFSTSSNNTVDFSGVMLSDEIAINDNNYDIMLHNNSYIGLSGKLKTQKTINLFNDSTPGIGYVTVAKGYEYILTQDDLDKFILHTDILNNNSGYKLNLDEEKNSIILVDANAEVGLSSGNLERGNIGDADLDAQDWIALTTEDFLSGGTYSDGVLTSGNYYLSDHVLIDTSLHIADNIEVNLSLNGNVLHRGTGSNIGYGILVSDNATLNLYDTIETSYLNDSYGYWNGGHVSSGSFDIITNVNDLPEGYKLEDDLIYNSSNNVVGSKFTGGYITGAGYSGYSGYSGAITLINNSNFSMNGGNIVGNNFYSIESKSTEVISLNNVGIIGNSQSLYIVNNSDLLLTDSYIAFNSIGINIYDWMATRAINLNIDNSSLVYNNAGIDIYSASLNYTHNINLFNDVTIFDNKYYWESTQKNIILNSFCSLNINESLGQNSKIGISTTVEPNTGSILVAQGTGDYTLTEDDANCFIADDSRYNIRLDAVNNSIILIDPDKYGGILTGGSELPIGDAYKDWTPLTTEDFNQLGTYSDGILTSGEYYLSGHVDLATNITIPEGEQVKLYLNDNALLGAEGSKSGNVLTVYGDLEVYDVEDKDATDKYLYKTSENIYYISYTEPAYDYTNFKGGIISRANYNNSHNLAGIYVNGSNSSLKIDGGNIGGNNGYPLYIRYSNNILLSNVNIFDNNYGFNIESSEVDFENVSIINNNYNTGVELWYSTLNMKGGELKNNGTGIDVSWNSTLNLSGGVIEDNKYQGINVYYEPNYPENSGIVNISSSPIIKNNGYYSYLGNTNTNVYLDGKSVLTLVAEMGNTTDTIGITPGIEPGRGFVEVVVGTEDYTITSSDFENFITDNADYELRFNDINNRIVLVHSNDLDEDIKEYPKISYTVGEHFDPTGLEVYAMSWEGSSGSTKVVPYEGNESCFEFSIDDTQALTKEQDGTRVIVTYTDKTDSSYNSIFSFILEVNEIFTVQGVVYDNNKEIIKDAVVNIRKNAETIHQTTTNSNGEFYFDNVEEDNYNLVVRLRDDDDDIQRIVERIAVHKDVEKNIYLLPENTTTGLLIEANKDIIITAVGGLTELAEQLLEDLELAVGETVDFLFTIDSEFEKESNSIVEDRFYNVRKDGEFLSNFLDINLSQTVKDENGNIVNDKTKEILEIDGFLELSLDIPLRIQDEGGYAIYREHNSIIDKILTKSNQYGEYITINEHKTKIDLSINRFSAYALAYSTSAIDEFLNNQESNSSYQISFNSNYGSAVNSMTTSSDGTLSNLPTTTKDGYTFEGWYLESTFDTEVTLNTEFTGNTTIYAKWTENIVTENTYTVSFFANGGSAVNSMTTNEYCKLSSLPNEPTRSGYTFEGWYLEDTFDTKVTLNTVFTGDTTIYAKWTKDIVTENTYTVSFFANGGSAVNSMTTNEYCKLSSLPNEPTRSGYTFEGWYLENTFDTEVTLNTVFSGNTTIYAKWEVISSNSSSSSSSSSSSNSSSSSTGSTSSSSGSGASLNASSNTSTSTGSNTSSNSNTSSSSNNSVNTSFVYTAFSDISGVQWSHNAIKYMNENTYMLGKGNGNFSPNETMTNEMFITVLSRFAQADINTTGEVYYTGAVSWANNNGIATELQIGSGISREDMAIYLYNYANTLGLDLPTGEATSDFADTTSLSSQSQTAINALQDAGVINGNGDGTYKPSQTATRAEVCQMLWKFALNVIDAQ